MRGLARQGVAARLERGAAQSAQLRRHRAPDARPLSLRPHRRSARGHPRARRGRRPRDRSASSATRSAATSTMKLAGELARPPDLPVAGGRRRQSDDRSRALRPRDRAARRTSRISGTSCGTCKARMRRKAGVWPGAFDLAPLDGIWTIRAFDDVYTAPHHGFARRDRLLPSRERACASSIASGFRR